MTSRCTIFNRVANFCRNILSRNDKEAHHSQATGQSPVICSDSTELRHIEQNAKKTKNTVRQFKRAYIQAEKIQTMTTETDENITIIPRSEHTISRSDISDNALKVLYRLNKNGFEAYLVGGGVRDLLLGKKPKDFDITTNATPEQIRKLFRNCRLVGRRFRLAHIMFGLEVIEVATFRGHHDQIIQEDKNLSQQAKNGMLLRDNIFGSIEEDAIRRDFTVNSLYYNINDFSVRDYVGGLKDLKQGILPLIGDPETRYREDPVRMLRAIRFACKLDMCIEAKTAHPIQHLAPLLREIPSARLFEESLKLFQAGSGYSTYKMLKEYHLFEQLFPVISSRFSENNDSPMEKIIEQVLKNADFSLKNDKLVNPAFLFSAMLWYPVTEHAEKLTQEGGLAYYDAFALAMNDILDDQCRSIAIPKRITTTMRDIWQLQLRLPRRQGHRASKLIEHPKFRSAFDLLELRANVERRNELQELTVWWDDYQHSNNSKQRKMITELGSSPIRKRHRPRKPSNGGRKPNKSQGA